MRISGRLAAMLVLVAAALPPAGAHASLVVPVGTPVGTAMDTVTLNGTYDAPLPTPLAQPFAALPFTLTLTLPAEVSVTVSASSFLLPVSGSYSNDGQMETFSNQISAFATAIGTSAINTEAVGLLIPGDFFDLYTTNVTPLYRPVILASALQSSADPVYQLVTGTISDASGSATYSPGGDPNFSGTITVAAGVPEPASWALLPAGLLALGAAVRRSRRV